MWDIFKLNNKKLNEQKSTEQESTKQESTKQESTKSKPTKSESTKQESTKQDHIKNNFTDLKMNTLEEFNIKTNKLISEYNVWMEQYKRNLNQQIKNYEKKSTEFETKIHDIKTTLINDIDNREEVLKGLKNVLDYDKIFRYQTNGLIDINDDLGHFRELGEGNYDILILVKKIKGE